MTKRALKLILFLAIIFPSTGFAAAHENGYASQEQTLGVIQEAFEALEVMQTKRGRLATNIEICRDQEYSNVIVFKVIKNDIAYTFYAIEKGEQRRVNYDALRDTIIREAGTSKKTITQIIGDHFPFSVSGTYDAFEGIAPILEEDQVIEYSLVEHKKKESEEEEERLCLNGQINEYLNSNQDHSHRFVANVVREIIKEVEEDKCLISEHIRTFILTYNSISDKRNASTCDITASNSLCNTLHCFMGGVQEFAKIVQALCQGKLVYLYHCRRDPERDTYFSATDFLTDEELRKKFAGSDEEQSRIAYEAYVESLSDEFENKQQLKGLFADVRCVCNNTYKGTFIVQNTAATG